MRAPVRFSSSCILSHIPICILELFFIFDAYSNFSSSQMLLNDFQLIPIDLLQYLSSWAPKIWHLLFIYLSSGLLYTFPRFNNLLLDGTVMLCIMCFDFFFLVIFVSSSANDICFVLFFSFHSLEIPTFNLYHGIIKWKQGKVFHFIISKDSDSLLDTFFIK